MAEMRSLDDQKAERHASSGVRSVRDRLDRDLLDHGFSDNEIRTALVDAWGRYYAATPAQRRNEMGGPEWEARKDLLAQRGVEI